MMSETDKCENPALRITISQDDNEGCRSEDSYEGVHDREAIDRFVEDHLRGGFVDESLYLFRDQLIDMAGELAGVGEISRQDPSVQGTLTFGRSRQGFRTMKKIPLTQAIALLGQAVDASVEGQPNTTLFQIGGEDEPFLTLETEDDSYRFNYVFEDEHNQEVEVDGEWMTLVASPDLPGNPEPSPVRMRLMRLMNLEEATNQ